MEARIDFLEWLQSDTALMVLMYLDDPSDLIRASAVSRLWRDFVTKNGLCKQLCFRLFPQLSSVAYVTEPSCGMKKSAESSNSVSWETLDREHRSYAFLCQALTIFTPSGCIAEAISASSTDRYPEESILHTLNPRDRFIRRASYWSSKGQRDPAVPETLIYKLASNLCVVTEISIQPFQAYFQPGLPIYSAKVVRFHMGHPKSPKDCESDTRDLPLQLPFDDKIIWTYTSPEFPIAQENRLQKFKLPAPVLCIGGFVQIELLGRVQRQESDELFYICVSHVEVLGRPLSPAFDIEILEPSGKFSLKYYPEAKLCLPTPPHLRQYGTSLNLLPRNVRDFEELFNMLGGNVPELVRYNWEEGDLD